MTLLEQIKAMDEKTSQLIAENPGMTGVWWEITDADVEEMRDLETDNCKMDYCPYVKRMRMNMYSRLYSSSTIFVFSKPVKVKQSFEIIETDLQTTETV